MQKMWKILYFMRLCGIFRDILFWVMSKYFVIFCTILSATFLLSTQSTFAENDQNTIFTNVKSSEQIRSGDFSFDDIPKILAWTIELLIGLAGTFSILALIYHAVQMQLASGITGDSSGVDKAKAGMKWALLGFSLAVSAWFLLVKFIQILESI